MLRLLIDENFSGFIVRGVLLRDPVIDLLRVQAGHKMPGVFVLTRKSPVRQAIEEIILMGEAAPANELAAVDG
jgi:hypothetical protein